MLDSFMILRANGVPVWERTTAPVNRDLVNSWIQDVFIDERTEYAGARAGQSSAQNPPYRKGKQTLKYVCVRDGHLNFVAVYQSILHLSWLDKLIDNIKTLFISLYGDQLTKPNTTRIECDSFDEYFDQQMRELERSGASASKPPTTAPDEIPAEAAPASADDDDDEPPSAPGLSYKGRAIKSAVHAQDGPGPSDDSTPAATPTGSRPSTPGTGTSNLVVGKPGPNKLSRRARKMQNAASNSAPPSSGDEGGSAKRGGKSGKTGKKGRKWDDDGMADEDNDVQLDYSAAAASKAGDSDAEHASRSLEQVDKSTWGNTTSKGQFVLKDLGDEVHSILAEAQQSKTETSGKGASSSGFIGSGLNTISGLFRNVVGGKTLTKEDTEKAMKGLLDHLLNKNVAHEAASRLCHEVENTLIGQKTGSFESINHLIQSATESALTKMLTPANSLDLLRDVEAVTRGGSSSLSSSKDARPYVISIVGVNGVGKSTNLSKICYFLLQNKKRVLVAAGDTFRSGAVEQLGVHVRNLKELTEREGGQVELYQRGYGKDAAQVARDAVSHAAAEGFDVVLIDTAGRRHNDQRLMSSLEKFANFAKPDKILMVGEALVGTDSVAQARNFNAAFGSARNLDGFIISKCDTVGGMVGTLVSLVHATNVPILFVGVGQHYSDLRNFSVKWAVEKLLAE